MFSNFLLLLVLNASELPEPLKQMIAARSQLRGGEIRYLVARNVPDRGPTLEKNYVARFAENGDTILEDRGDGDGWVLRDSEGAPISKFPRILLRNSEGQWETYQTTITADRFPAASQPAALAPILDLNNPEKGIPPGWEGTFHDPRTFGIWPEDCNRLDGFAILSRLDRDGVEWRVRQDGAIFFVTAAFGGSRVEWEIDSGANWSPRRVALYSGDNCRSESVSELKRIGGVWLPIQCTFYEHGRRVETIAVSDADFEHPARFAAFPTSTVIQPGTQVWDRTLPSPALVVWNGERTQDWQDWNSDVSSGQRKGGENWDRFVRRAPSVFMTPENERWNQKWENDQAIAAPLTRALKLWEDYVNKFVVRYSLNDEQTQKANSILKECQDRARDIVSRIRENQVSISHNTAAKQDADSQDQTKRTILTAKIIGQQLQSIFEHELKPRLEKIPTREQLKAASTDPATRPETSRPALPAAP